MNTTKWILLKQPSNLSNFAKGKHKKVVYSTEFQILDDNKVYHMSLVHI